MGGQSWQVLQGQGAGGREQAEISPKRSFLGAIIITTVSLSINKAATP